jgi:hypothetical protein
MKKLKLRLDDLRIDSFSTTPVEKAKGTVFGGQCTCQSYDYACVATGDASCDVACDTAACGTGGERTCEDSCVDCTCQASCGGQTCGYYTCRGWYTGDGGPLGGCAICD